MLESIVDKGKNWIYGGFTGACTVAADVASNIRMGDLDRLANADVPFWFHLAPPV